MRNNCLLILGYFCLTFINWIFINNGHSVLAQNSICNINATIPANIDMEKYLKVIVEKALHHSATFREQCDRISKSNNLSVVIKILPYLPDGVRALSQIKRLSNGKIKIEVMLIPQLLISYIEMLGHEFEHIVEQIEGIELTQMSSNVGVYRSFSGRYETLRAINAGHQVMQEFEAGKKGVSSINR